MRAGDYLILDASAAVAWVMNDPGAGPVGDAVRHALRLGMFVVGPTALQAEVQAVIAKRVQRKMLDAEGGRLSSAFWTSLVNRVPIDIHERHDHHPAALTLSIATGHCYFACLYLALARKLGGELLTCDPSLARKAQEQGIVFRLPVLAEL
ncbi:MAG: type II toxin-antitoxin system VapC family toxin [Alphaproteobacteria bacterium]|nr:type II toxin-antitoxin system VapC family toxin [Alphaproteobacteria bacterium]